jgi:HAD superfamily hydrolase (TIGR01509 family)
LQPIHGNALRMRLALESLQPPLPPAELETAAQRLKQLKRQLYIEQYLPRLSLRPGIRPLIGSALERGVRLAIVSTSDDEQIHALLRHHLPEAAPHFRPILGKDAGQKTAPDSPLYRRALAELGTSVSETLVIEDSQLGFHAARAAGLPCAVFYNHYTYGQDFAGARLVARSLEFFDLDTLTALCLDGTA